MSRFTVAGVKSTSPAPAAFSSRTASSRVRTVRTTTCTFRLGAVSCALRAAAAVVESCAS